LPQARDLLDGGATVLHLAERRFHGTLKQGCPLEMARHVGTDPDLQRRWRGQTEVGIKACQPVQSIYGNMDPPGKRMQLIRRKESVLLLDCPERFNDHPVSTSPALFGLGQAGSRNAAT
jgi:hypothetical protein